METSRSDARVSTDRPARFGKQLVSHLGRKHGGEWDDDAHRGHIALADGRAEVSCEPDTLVLQVQGPADALERLEDVVGRHLVRFDSHDELVVAWTRADGTPGSRQSTPPQSETAE